MDMEELKNEALGIKRSVNSSNLEMSLKRLRVIHSKLLHYMVKSAYYYSDTDCAKKVKPSIAQSYADFVHKIIVEIQNNESLQKKSGPTVTKREENDFIVLSLADDKTKSIPYLDISESSHALGNFLLPGVNYVNSETNSPNPQQQSLQDSLAEKAWSTMLGGKNYDEDGTSNLIDNFNSEEIDKFLQNSPNDKMKIIKFWADWCGPSLSFKPKWDEFVEHMKSKAEIYHVNVGNDSERKNLALKWKIKSFPSVVLIIGDKKIILENVASASVDKLIEHVNKYAQ